jgi:hypothetical protein
MESQLASGRVQGRRRISQAEGRYRDRRLWRALGVPPACGDSQEDFQKDRERQNKIALLGWQVLRFTWLDLTEYPQRVLTLIRRAISAC